MAQFTDSQIAYLKLLFQRRLEWKGAWVAGSYTTGDVVTNDGVVWVATDTMLTGTPGVDARWVSLGVVGSGTGGAFALGDASDVVLTSPVSGNMLRYNGTNWVNATPSYALDDLSDVVLTSPVSGNMLRYNGTNWVNATPSYALDDLSDVTITTPATGHTLYYSGTAWVNNPVVQWVPAANIVGQFLLDFSEAAQRTWTESMPGIVFKQPNDGGAGILRPGLYLNMEDADGDRLDMGWGGLNGGNFELYSKNHTARPGEFRITYGGAVEDPPSTYTRFGHIQFTHYEGHSNRWFAVAGITKEGRFWCGLHETGIPGSADCVNEAFQEAGAAPAYPFQVYNEDFADPAEVFHVEATGAFGAQASLATAPTALLANRFLLWQDTANPDKVMLTVSDGSATHATYDLTAVPAPGTSGNVLTSSGTAWTSAAPAQQIPAGAVMAFAMSTAPTGWLKCNGIAVSRTTYAALFAAIKTTFGGGDGSTTFNLPDLRGEFARGWADDRAGIADSGRTFGSAQEEGIKEHSHLIGVSITPRGTGADTATLNGTSDSFYDGDGTGKTPLETPSTPDETRPRNVALLYCIKT